MKLLTFGMMVVTIFLSSTSILTMFEIFDSETFTHSYTHELCTPMLWTDGYFDCKNINFHILRLIGAFTLIGGLIVYWWLKLADMKESQNNTEVGVN